MKEKKKQLIVVALVFALLLLIGGTYAYFSINATSDKTGAKVAGKANNLGNPTMQIKTSKLYLNLDANLMSQANAGKTYYANENENGLALETNPNYTLATAQLPEGDEALDCTYNYKVTATVTTPITDNSDSDVKVVVGEKTMTLKELTTAGTTGIIVSGEIKNLTKGQSVSIPLTSSVTNTANTQDKLVGNSYTIKIEPYTSGDTKAFSCKLAYQIDITKTLAQNLVDSGWLWQSGLEDDGYRYAGQGVTCSYDSGNYIDVANNQSTTPTCRTIYNYTRTTISSGATSNYTYAYNCPSNTSSYIYSCTELNAVPNGSNVPNNFICFGTADKSECTANKDKYMYRVLGVFADTSGENHVKLIKYKQLGSYKWYSGSETNITWENSDMYKGLNGEYFLTNPVYDYMQNTTWNNKIENWTWSAVNTKTFSDYGPKYGVITTSEMYLHEMNKSGKSSEVGEWTTPSAKIGLMYASDYQMSWGSRSLVLTSSSSSTLHSILKTGWMHQSNNEIANGINNYVEWTISNGGIVRNEHEQLSAWYVDSYGLVSITGPYTQYGVRPVFYLTGDVKITANGDGSLENPFMIKE